MYLFISFLEGIITFISPCLLPMLPIYLSYFAGGQNKDTRRTVIGALGFVLGFTVVFVALGALAGTLGSFLIAHQNVVNIVSGIIVIFFGLNFLGIFKFSLFKGSKITMKMDNFNFFSLVLFGIIFSIGWTPCVGAFLGSALMLASQQGHALAGMLMLLTYSLGLGIPFILSAVLIQKLKTAFDFIKRNYQIINTLSGCFLILTGIMMATGTLGRLLNILSFS
ncbi:MAG: cytochrome c biogenesis CcdA family protein [Lachnospiraceae bacterium]|nr:cytochrome c biogenesis CcdA family protein [Lachnospiraceae bacterium]MDD7025925.1 cytochrome c biogenesis CcdA family protein [Lachnospiraceae bacterium]